MAAERARKVGRNSNFQMMIQFFKVATKRLEKQARTNSTDFTGDAISQECFNELLKIFKFNIPDRRLLASKNFK